MAALGWAVDQPSFAPRAHHLSHILSSAILTIGLATMSTRHRQLLQQRDKKLIDVARSVGYQSDAAFSKAFKRVVGANPGEYLKRGI